MKTNNDRTAMSGALRAFYITRALVLMTTVFLAIGAIVLVGIFGVTKLLAVIAEKMEWAWLNISGTEWVGVLALLVIGLVVVMATAALLTLAERKWSAKMQNRIGPNRARIIKGSGPWMGLPHVLADTVKMLTKEDFVPPAGNAFLFNLGPFMAMAPAFALIAVVPFGPDLSAFGVDVRFQAARLDFGMLWVFAIASLAVYGTTLAGWASNNKFSLMGALRASAQMISYEVTLGLTLVGAFLLYESLQPMGIVAWQDGVLYGLPKWGVIYQPVAFLFFIVAAFAEIKRAPFDLPEADPEIVGYFIEYSGMKFGIFMVSEFVELVILSGIIVTLFFGGWSIPWLPYGELQAWLSGTAGLGDWGALLAAWIALTVFAGKMMFFVWLQMLIRWSFPRFRYDQLMDVGWKMILPLSLVNVVITAVAVILDPSLKWALGIGLVECLVFAGYYLSVKAPARTDPLHAETAHSHGH
ncbi:MAG: NADH-quinone oxidoreductase subunit H [Deltaproteobacteria bacterium]|nr:NADH-quinone oxidoreductase subunit H [Deltaproteobacteria bacterium]